VMRSTAAVTPPLCERAVRRGRVSPQDATARARRAPRRG
jgi:hypothetical protein